MSNLENQPVQKRTIGLSGRIFIGLAAGIVVGLLMGGVPEIAEKYIQPFGTFFMNLVKMCIVPLVFASIVMGTCGIGDIKKMGRIGIKTLVYFLFTTACAATIGLIIGTLMDVGKGISIPAETTEVVASEAPSFIQTILDLVPTNPFAALADGNMLQVIVFAMFVGYGITAVGERSESFKNAMDGFAEIMYKIIGGIMNLAPFAVFALICPVVATNGSSVLLPLLGLIIAVYLSCILHAAIVYSGSVAALGKTSPRKFFKAMIPAIVFAFSTASSASTLPFTLESSRKLGVPTHIRSFVIPLGATINMDGTAAFQGVCALFIARVYGIDLSPQDLVTIVATATLASIGTAGVPGAGTVMLSMVLTSVGLPIEGVGLIMGVERILDMIRTAVNITGDAACSVIVAASEKELLPGEAE